MKLTNLILKLCKYLITKWNIDTNVGHIKYNLTSNIINLYK